MPKTFPDKVRKSSLVGTESEDDVSEGHGTGKSAEAPSGAAAVAAVAAAVAVVSRSSRRWRRRRAQAQAKAQAKAQAQTEAQAKAQAQTEAQAKAQAQAEAASLTPEASAPVGVGAPPAGDEQPRAAGAGSPGAAPSSPSRSAGPEAAGGAAGPAGDASGAGGARAPPAGVASGAGGARAPPAGVIVPKYVLRAGGKAGVVTAADLKRWDLGVGQPGWHVPEAEALRLSEMYRPKTGMAPGDLDSDDDDDRFNPNMVLIGRIALRCLRIASNSPADEERVLRTIDRMSTDFNPYVRVDLMEYVPYMASFLHSENMEHVICTRVIPWVMNCLQDESYVVREAAQLALIVLIERSLIPDSLVKEVVCPAVLEHPLEVFFADEVDFVTGIVKLICKMAKMFGREATEKLFLDKFCLLAKHSHPNIRRVVVSNFVDFAMVVSQSSVKKLLLPLLVGLVEDNDCMVRKACPVVALSLSCMIPLEARKNILTPSFVKLLVDQERIVQQEAFCSLGPFIATLAVPSVTDLFYNENGILHLVSQDGCEFRLSGSDVNSDFDNLIHGPFHPRELIDQWRPENAIQSPAGEENRQTPRILIVAPQRDGILRGQESGFRFFADDGGGDLEGSFNSFQFWRHPIPECEVHPALLQRANRSVDRRPSPSASRAPSRSRSRSKSKKRGCQQDVVPQVLVDKFLSMSVPVGPTHGQDWGDDYRHVCAYNLPAVALTLGQANWPVLRPTFQLLSQSPNPKLRRTIASYMHELAAIVGEDIAASELLPKYKLFLYDEDEVKVAAVEVFAGFVRALPETERQNMLPEIPLIHFEVYANELDWRVRDVWAIQLEGLVSMYSVADVDQEIKYHAMELMMNKVDKVRTSAALVILKVIQKLKLDIARWRVMRKELEDLFARARQWERRKVFVYLCSLAFQEETLDWNLARELTPLLFELKSDHVVNVRLAVARALGALLKRVDSLPSDTNVPVGRNEIVQVLLSMRDDTDIDVIKCALGSVEGEP